MYLIYSYPLIEKGSSRPLASAHVQSEVLCSMMKVFLQMKEIELLDLQDPQKDEF